MAQYDVYPGKPRLGYLLNCQHDMLEHLPTRAVVPLMPLDHGKPVNRLNPIFDVNGDRYMMAVQFIFTIEAAELGDPLASLASRHIEITGALDMLISGI